MFTYRTQLHLKDTDATGVLFFSNQFSFALEAFEAFLKERGFGWDQLMSSPFLLPVVHAEADFLAPLMVGDSLEISLEISHIGTSSVTLHYTLCNPTRSLTVGTAKIVHVVVSRETRQSLPIPDFLRSIFESELSSVHSNK